MFTAAGDYDGDDKIDPAVYRPSTGGWYILKSSTSFTTSVAVFWGLSTDIPIPGDYDGDGMTDPTVERPSTGMWYILESSTGYASSFAYGPGLSGDVLVPGDYDGDGLTDPAVYSGASGTWTDIESGLLTLRGGKAGATLTGSTLVYATVNASNPLPNPISVWSDWTFGSPSPAWAAMVVRFSDADNLLLAKYQNGEIRLERRQSGVWASSPLGTRTLPSPAVGVHRMRVEVVSNSVRVFWDSVLQLEVTDTSGLSGTRVGLAWSGSDSTATADNFEINANLAPTVSVTSPVTGAGFYQAPGIPLQVSTNDPEGQVGHVEFYANGSQIGDSSAAPYGFTFYGAGIGTHVVTAKVYDAVGATTTSMPITITVSNATPSASLINPANGATFHAPATVLIQAAAGDPDGTITHVEFYSNGALVGNAPVPTGCLGLDCYEVTPTLGVGTYVMTARSYDNTGAWTASAPITITVGNAAPSVSLINPANGATFHAPASIPVQASAVDSDGTIAHVEFYANGTFLGDAATPTTLGGSIYEITASRGVGTYVMTAKSYDETGAWTESASRTITVTNQPPTVTLAATEPFYITPAAILLAATASDSDGTIAHVEFYLNGTTLIGDDTSAPHSATSGSLTVGSYAFTAKAYDETGAVTTSAPLTVNVDPYCSHMTISPQTVALGLAGGTQRVTVTVPGSGTTSSCWQAQSSATWATLAIGPAGTGASGYVDVSASPFHIMAERNATLTIAGLVVAVSQTGAILPSNAVVYDSLSGSGAMAGRVPDISTNSAAWSATGLPAATVANGTVIPSGQHVNDDELWTAINSGLADGVIGVDWFPTSFSLPQNAQPTGGIMFRIQDANNYWVAGYGFWSFPLALWKVTNGVWGTPTNSIQPIAVTYPGDPRGAAHRIEVRLNGPSIEVWYDDVLQIQHTDFRGATSTTHGLRWSPLWDWFSGFDNFTVAGSAPCVTGLTPTTLNMPGASGTGTLTVSATAGCEWTPVATAPWVTITGYDRTAGTMTLSVPENATWATRDAPIYAGGKVAVVSQQSIPRPENSPCAPSISPPSADFGTGGGNGAFFSVIVPEGCWWEVVAYSNWLVPAIAPFSGSGTLQYAVNPNETGQARGGTITVADLNFGVVRNFGVNQSGTGGGAGDLAIVPALAQVDSNGGTGTVAVLCNGGCSWAAVSQAAWVQVEGSGTSSGSFTYSVDSHGGAATRSSTVSIGSQSLTVFQEAAGRACPGTDPNNPTIDPENANLQACLNAGGTILLEPGSPGYIVKHKLLIMVDGTTLKTSDGASEKATLVAGYDLADKILDTAPGGRNNVTIDRIRFEGQVDVPNGRSPNITCLPGDRPANVGLSGDDLRVFRSESRHAICGSGMGVQGKRMKIIGNQFTHNGRSETTCPLVNGENKCPGGQEPWADGLTALNCDHGEIRDNYFEDNTDIDLPVDGPSCEVTGNTIRHFGKYGFAGLNAGWWENSPTPGNHQDSIFERNHVEAWVPDTLGLGMLIGAHPWIPLLNSSNVIVRTNTVFGATFNTMIEGLTTGANIDADNVSTGHQGTRSLNQQCKVSLDYVSNSSDSSGPILGNPIPFKYLNENVFGSGGERINCCQLEPNSTAPLGWSCKP